MPPRCKESELWNRNLWFSKHPKWFLFTLKIWDPLGQVIHGITKSRTRLSNLTFTFHFHALEKETATHSSVLAWRIPGIGKPGGLPSMGLHTVGHDWSDWAAAAAAAAVKMSKMVWLQKLLEVDELSYSDSLKRETEGTFSPSSLTF